MKNVTVISLSCVLMILFLHHLASLQGNGMTDPDEQVDFLRKSLLLSGDQFYNSFGRYPEGDADEILRQLGGANRLKTTFINLDAKSYSVNGNLMIILGRRLRFESSGKTFDISVVKVGGIADWLKRWRP